MPSKKVHGGYVPPNPVGQPAPPARAAASGSKSLSVARGSTGTGCSRDNPQDRSLRQDRSSWQRGYRAGCIGLSACPFPAGTAESWSWISGYIEGKAARVAKPKSSASRALQTLTSGFLTQRRPATPTLVVIVWSSAGTDQAPSSECAGYTNRQFCCQGAAFFSCGHIQTFAKMICFRN